MVLWRVSGNAIIQLDRMATRERHTRLPEFEKVRPRKVSAIVAEQIIEAITRGDFPVGSKLPPEFDLAERMGVSRPSVREALSALQAVGVIESRPGSGNYVLRHPPTADEDAASHLIESEDGCLEVMEARMTLEPPIAFLVAQKADESTLQTLDAAIDNIRAKIREGRFNAYLDADKAFHVALVEATGNRLVQDALTPLLASIDQKLYREYTHHYYLKNVADFELVAELHAQIVDAIRAGDPDLAFARMNKHWTRMLEIWEA